MKRKESKRISKNDKLSMKLFRSMLEFPDISSMNRGEKKMEI